MTAKSRYLPGYSEALARVGRMPLGELLALIDSLYGRDDLKYGDDVEAVRAEALRQCERDFTNPAWVREGWGRIMAEIATGSIPAP